MIRSTTMTTCTVDGCTAPIKARGLCKSHYQMWLRGNPTIEAGPSTRGQRSDHCSVPGCGAKPVGRGLCQRHYARLQRTGEVGPAESLRYGKQGLECSIEGCERRSYSANLCVHHYENRRLRGDALAEGPGRGKRPPPEWMGGPCAVDGCKRPAQVAGRCTMHHQRLKRLGDAGGAAPMIAPRGSGTINQNGYREIQADGQRWLEHRYVMTQMLGRPLTGDENVHHINGDRADNRPENLELWVTAQPPRQNVEDLVAWAHQILADYEGDVKQLQLFHDPPKRRKRTTATA